MRGLRRLMARALGAGRRGPAPRPERPVYAIGDVHGRADLLGPMLIRICADAAEERARAGAGAPPAELVLLGDVIDRGPDSRQVLDQLAALADVPDIAPVFLTGNHERMLLDFLASPYAHRGWLRYGGWDTLVSYGLGEVGDLGDDRELRRIAGALGQAMGPHLALIGRFVDWHLNGNLFFTHAGAEPDIAPEAQPIQALHWGPAGPPTRARPDGLVVVHGHTVVEEPMLIAGHLSIDTGAYLTGRLTALKATAEGLGFLTETGPPGEDRDLV